MEGTVNARQKAPVKYPEPKWVFTTAFTLIVPPKGRILNQQISGHRATQARLPAWALGLTAALRFAPGSWSVAGILLGCVGLMDVVQTCYVNNLLFTSFCKRQNHVLCFTKSYDTWHIFIFYKFFDKFAVLLGCSPYSRMSQKKDLWKKS